MRCLQRRLAQVLLDVTVLTDTFGVSLWGPGIPGPLFFISFEVCPALCSTCQVRLG